MKFYFLIIALLLSLPTIASAQDQKEEVLKLDTNLVLIDVAVSSKSKSTNAPVLRPEDFIITEDGVRQKIESFSTTDVPLNIALLIDTSGSTKGDIDLIRTAAKRFIADLRPNDRLAVIEFNSEVTVYENLTSDRTKLSQAIDWLQPGTGTAFYDALQTAIEKVFATTEGRKAIVALTDGVDSDGNAVYENILPLLEKSRVSSYFLELNTEEATETGMMKDCDDKDSFYFSTKQLQKYLEEYADSADSSQYKKHCSIPKLERMQINRRLYESARKELRELSSQTGGHVYPCRRLSDLSPAYDQIAAELRTQYTLGYYPTNEKRDGKWRSLRIETRRADILTKTKPGYRAPGE